MSNLPYLFRQGFTSLRKDRGFVATVLLTMGITIGVFLLAATLNYFLLLRPLPYDDQERLYSLQYQRVDQNGEVQTKSYLFSAAEQLFTELSKGSEELERLALLYFASETVTSEQPQLRLNVAYVTPEAGDILSVRLYKGSWFTKDHERGSGNRGAIISYETWRHDFNGSADIVSRQIVVNGVSHPILGVLEKNFFAPQLADSGLTTQLWLPWDFNRSPFKKTWSVVDNAIYVLAKVKKDPAPLTLLATSIADEAFRVQLIANPAFDGWHAQVTAEKLRDAITSRSVGAIVLMVLGAVGLLLISTANIVSLFLARMVAKQKQLAISASLGGKRFHLWQMQFVETFILLLLASVFGVALAEVGFVLIQKYFSANFARAEELGLTPFTVFCALGVALVLSLIISFFAVRTLNYSALSLSLRGSGKGLGVQVSSKVRKGLMIFQVSVALILVFFSAILVRESAARLSRPIGLESAPVVRIEFDIATMQFLGWNAYVPKVKELGERLRTLPSVEGLSFSRSPLNDVNQFALTYDPTGVRYFPFHRNVDHHYLDVAGQKLIVGNGFQYADVQSRTNVAMINETFARLLSDDITNVIGKKLSVDTIPPATIIGVVQDINLPSKRETPPRFYVPNFGTATWILLKLKPNAHVSRDDVVKIMSETDKQFALAHFGPLDEDIAKLKFPYLATLVASLALAVFTVLLACVGLFGIINFNAQSQSLAFSIKLAIGAKYRHILNETISENTAVLAVGTLLGTMTIVAIGVYFPEVAKNQISWALVPLYVLSLAVVAAVTVISCILPMRRYKSRPIVEGLRGIE